MIKGIKKIVSDGHAKLVPLNFFNARIAPFKKTEEGVSCVRRVKCLIINDSDYKTRLFYKNITLNLYE